MDALTLENSDHDAPHNTWRNLYHAVVAIDVISISVVNVVLAAAAVDSIVHMSIVWSIAILMMISISLLLLLGAAL